MAGTMSDYLANMLLDASCSDGSFTEPDNLYVGMATANITGSTTGSTVTEPSNWTDYARVEVTSTNLSAASGRAKTNSEAITITSSATCSSDEDCIDWFLADAASDGNILWYGTFASTVTVQDGDSVSIAIGALDLAISTTEGTP